MVSKSIETIPLVSPNLCGNEAKYLQECIATNYVSSVGPFVTRFEQQICQQTGAKYAITTCSGTSALHMALNAVGVEENELVIIPSFTFIATANAVKHCGADPWIFDICPENWGLDPNLLKKTLENECESNGKELLHTQSKKRIGAIVVVHALGIPSSINEIIHTAKKFGIPIVVDAAGAIGSKYQDKELGELEVDCSVLSFNGNKLITTGGGGCVILNDPLTAQRIRHLVTTARPTQEYLHDEVGYNYRMTNIEAALGCAQLENLSKFLAHKSYIARRYNDISGEFKSVKMFPNPIATTPNHWLSGLVLPGAQMTLNLIEHMIINGIDARKFWVPMHKQPPYKNCYRTTQSYVESLYQNILILPCSTNLSDSQIDDVSTIVIEGLKKLKCP